MMKQITLFPANEIDRKTICAFGASGIGFSLSPIASTSMAIASVLSAGALSIFSHQIANHALSHFPSIHSSFSRALVISSIAALAIAITLKVYSLFITTSLLTKISTTMFGVSAVYLFFSAIAEKWIFPSQTNELSPPLEQHVKAHQTPSLPPPSVISLKKGVWQTISQNRVVVWCKAHFGLSIVLFYSVKGTITLLFSYYFGSKLFSSFF